MNKWLMQCLGFDTHDKELDKYERIYGLPRKSLDEWLSRNPVMKREYEAELRARSLRSQTFPD